MDIDNLRMVSAASSDTRRVLTGSVEPGDQGV